MRLLGTNGFTTRQIDILTGNAGSSILVGSVEKRRDFADGTSVIDLLNDSVGVNTELTNISVSATS
ncbi:MAG: hypothetical protein ACREIT_11360, partial [Tepidisphaeraceae bacterium]